MNNFIREINKFYNNNIYYTDTDSLYIEKRYWDVLDKVKLIGKNLGQGKNDYETGGIFYGFFLGPKIKCVLTVNELGNNEQHMTFKGFNDNKRFFDRSRYFNMLEGKNKRAMLPQSWKKIF